MSERIRSVQSPPLVELMKLSNDTAGCISLAQGVPSYSPPRDVMDSFIPLVAEHSTHQYTADPGLIEVRESISSLLHSDFKMNVDPEYIVVTPGANQGFINAILTLCNPGDKVLLISPYYFNHKMALDLFGFKPVIYDLNSDFSIDFNELRSVMNGVKVVVFVNPGNPTGYALGENELREFSDFLSDEYSDVTVISDETYNYFTYDEKHIPMVRFYPKTVTISSFSKSFGIPGWRVGFYSASPDLAEESMKVQDTTVICAPKVSQLLVKHLIDNRHRFLQKSINYVEHNHKIASELLEDIHVLDLPPHNSAYYIFPKITQFTSSRRGFELANHIIQKFKVAIVPGEAFGDRWRDNIRISFANVGEENLIEGIGRLKRGLVF